jgi:hypothetical protein
LNITSVRNQAAGSNQFFHLSIAGERLCAIPLDQQPESWAFGRHQPLSTIESLLTAKDCFGEARRARHWNKAACASVYLLRQPRPLATSVHRRCGVYLRAYSHVLGDAEDTTATTSGYSCGHSTS